MTKNNFIVNIYDAAYKHLKSLGKDDRAADFYARILASQACLESDYGNKVTGDYNYFGLKATQEQDGKVVTTHEFSGVNKIKIRDKFLNFSSMEEGVQNAVNRIGNKFHAFDGELTPESYVDTIHKYKYFTDDKASYLKNIKGIMNGSVLPEALKEHKVNVPPKPIALPLPSFPNIQLIHQNDATRVKKPQIPPKLGKGGYIDAQTVLRIRELLRSFNINR